MGLFQNRHHTADPLWHVQLVVLIIVILQLLLPKQLNALPPVLLPALELICLIALQALTPQTAVFDSKLRRIFVLALIGLVVIANGTSLELLVYSLFTATAQEAPMLLLSAANIYVTNIVIFGLLYWEMDGGGPGQRRAEQAPERDFLFPQQNSSAKTPWHPTFIDYLYTSTTNGMAFSPTDTLPLSRRAKMLMAGQALLSSGAVILVVARAINIL